MIKDFFHRLHYFLYYLFKLPFIKLKEFVKTFNRDSFKKLNKPSFVADFLAYLIFFMILIGRIDKLLLYLSILMVFTRIYKVWKSGDDIRDRRINYFKVKKKI